ncbi:hypothetical protein GGI07_005327 [Coemansia sp. Benny D115]|nr:hypothetical protein GGI07_005327 [Coemansia sp. Benny D115]
MVQLSAALVFATTLLGSLVSAVPLADTLPRRDYHEVNTNYYPEPKTVTVTVTKYLNGNAPHYTASQAQPEYTESYTPSGNDWKSEMLQQVNAIRAEVGLAPLRIDERLNNMAQQQSNYQNQIQTMTHANSAGSLGQRCTNVGVQWQGVAENVAWNYKDVTAVVQGWKKSPGHYANMVGDYNIVGFGENNLYWTQDFATV